MWIKFLKFVEEMEIEEGMNPDSNTRKIEPEKDKTPVTNHGDVPLVSIGEILNFFSLTMVSTKSFYICANLRY